MQCILDTFSAILTRKATFVSAFQHTKLVSTLQEKNLLPWGANPFLLE